MCGLASVLQRMLIGTPRTARPRVWTASPQLQPVPLLTRAGAEARFPSTPPPTTHTTCTNTYATPTRPRRDFPLSYGTNDPIYNMEALEALAALRHLRSL